MSDQIVSITLNRTIIQAQSGTLLHRTRGRGEQKPYAVKFVYPHFRRRREFKGGVLPVLNWGERLRVGSATVA